MLEWQTEGGMLLVPGKQANAHSMAISQTQPGCRKASFSCPTSEQGTNAAKQKILC